MVDRPHALIVGASSGIGRALAERLASSHAVSAIARREDRLAELAALGVRTFAGDIAALDGIGGLVQSVIDVGGALDALIYCAGTQIVKPLRAFKPGDISHLCNVNLVAPTVLATLFASKRVAAPDAVFCVVSSIAADRPEAGIVPYAASKAGLSNLVAGMARELGPRRAVGVAPGWIDTEMTQAYGYLYDDAFRERLKKASPAGPATVEAVVDTIMFLLSPAARSITGQVVRIDGGAAI